MGGWEGGRVEEDIDSYCNLPERVVCYEVKITLGGWWIEIGNEDLVGDERRTERGCVDR